MELTRERLITIITSAVVVVVLLLYFSLYRPLINKLRLAHLECKTIEVDLLQIHKIVDSLKTISIKKGLITEKDISLVIDELTKEDKSKRLNFISLTPKQVEKEQTFYKTLPLEMEIESSYEGIARFLGRLDELKNCIAAVRKFNIIPTQEGSIKNLKIKLVLNLYLLK